jgi:hypothetical protein
VSGAVPRVLALVVLAGAGWLLWGSMQTAAQAERPPIWIRPGEYRGPPVGKLDTAQIEAIGQRAQNLNF